MYGAGPQTATFQVPNGSGIQIQLMGFASTGGAGCPTLSSIFAGTGNVPGMNGPWLLASTTLDISSDTTVSLTAAFSSSTAQQLYQNCAVGSQANAIAPTRAFSGSINAGGGASGAPALTLAQDATPTGFVSTSMVGSIVPAGLSTLPTFCNGNCEQNSPPAVPNMISATTIANRAAIQFVWDLTANAIPLTNYGNFNLFFRGGQQDSCATGQAYGASAGVWDQAAGKWILLGNGTYTNGNPSGDTLIQWTSGTAPLDVPLSSLAVTGSDGDQYVVVNVESNYVGTSLCPSAVYVGNAGFASTTSVGNELNSNNNQLNLISNGIMGGGGGSNSIIAGNSQSLLFTAQGGTPPYTYTCNTTNDLGCTITNTGIYTAGPSGTTDTVTVTDSSTTALTSQIQVNLTLATSPLGVIMALDPSSASQLTANGDGSYSVSADACLQFDANAVSYAGLSLGTVNFTGVTYQNALTGTPVTANGASCISVAPTSFTSAQTTGIFVKPGKVGFMQLSAQTTSPTNQAPSSAMLYVTPGVYVGVSMISPQLMTVNECIPVTILLADQFGNANPTAGAGSATVSGLTANSIGAGGNVYAASDTTCSTPLTTFTVNSGAGTAFNFMDTALDVFAGGTDWDGSAGGTTFYVPGGTGGPAIKMETAGQATAIKLQYLAGPDSSGCMEFNIGTVDSSGAWTQPQGGGIVINLGMPIGSKWFLGGSPSISQADCDSNNSGLTGGLTVSASPWYDTVWISNYQSSNYLSANQSSGPTPTLPPTKVTVP